MDRRRILLLTFALLVVAAVGDIYINRLSVFEQFAEGFTFKVEEEEPLRTVEVQGIYDAAGIERFFMEERRGMIVVVGDAIDEIIVTATVDIFAPKEEDADAFAQGLRIEADTEGGTFVPRLGEEQRKGIRRIDAIWEIRVPEHLAVEVKNRFGFIGVGNVQGPVDVSGSGSMQIVEIGGTVTVWNDLGLVELHGVGGDAFVEMNFGSLDLRDLAGSLDLNASAVDSRISHVKGSVTIDSRLGTIQMDRVDGKVSVRQSGFGLVIANNLMGEIDVESEAGNVIIQQGAAAPITATVNQGALSVTVSRAQLSEYHFALEADPDEMSISPEIAQILAEQGELENEYPVRATVKHGGLRVQHR